MSVAGMLAAADGPLFPVQAASSDEIAAGAAYATELLVEEVSISTNTTAAGGNASLMAIG